ncbi:WecB/TagA/CpsF family glycosyltransferase, partial [Candidatus Microgenomates bacterium]|nr:WecB/TagA/CpsF family glycosyltransferase [Candidatus Microgenomates bacterium]
IPAATRQDILENVIAQATHHERFTHVVSINPENVVVAQSNAQFADVLNQAQVKLIDGVGIKIAASVLGIPAGDRVSGVDLMAEIVGRANSLRLRVALIGGAGDLAERLAYRYQQAQPEATFFGLQGFKNIKNPEKNEENRIKSVILDLRPHLVFVSFGSPAQELWIDSQRELFKNCVCIGVGGAFDFLGGQVPRAPGFMRSLGLEWLFRLWVQPWRWRRQLRLVRFAGMVLKQKLWKKAS